MDDDYSENGDGVFDAKRYLDDGVCYACLAMSSDSGCARHSW